MRAFEFLVEAAKPKVGREFQHLEDLVFTDPDRGAIRAVEVLKNLSQDASNVSIKWDGYPTVYWGRDVDGNFMLVGKNNWGKEEGRSKSPEELEQFILSRGKGEDWRPRFAKQMSALWPIFEKATPKDFRGYVYGDLLYHPGSPYEGSDGTISFKPNPGGSTYNVKATSNIGRKISKSKVAVAAHLRLENFGDSMSEGEPLDDIQIFRSNPDLVVFGQTYVSTQPEVNVDNIESISKIANQKQPDIKRFFEPVKGLSNLAKIFYSFVNAMSRENRLDSIGPEAFNDFISMKVSQGQQGRIQQKIEDNPGTIENIFYLIREIMQGKNEIIRELDAAEGDITATTGGEKGGEGYVSSQDYVKLVPRHRWKPS